MGKNHHTDYSHCEGLSETASKLQRKGPTNPFLKINYYYHEVNWVIFLAQGANAFLKT